MTEENSDPLSEGGGKAAPVSLIRKSEDTSVIASLDRIGERFLRGLRQVIADLGCVDAQIKRSKTASLTLDDIHRDGTVQYAHISYALNPIKGGALLILPQVLIQQLVDVFYGGSGDGVTEREGFTQAEMHFIERLGYKVQPVFALAWAEHLKIKPVSMAVATDATEVKFAQKHEPVIVQTLEVSGGPLQSCKVHCVYRPSTMRLFKRDPLPVEETEMVVDPEWRSALNDAVMQVHLPVRTIFARPEMPVSKIMALKPGDIIPVCLPNTLPMTVAGRRFAEGTIGQSSGRAAIRIEKLIEGTLQDE